MKTTLENAFKEFEEHYRLRLGDVSTEFTEEKKDGSFTVRIHSNLLKKGNCPTILSRGERTKEVIVLTHGLSDSPHYVEAIGRRFFKEGFNVILPLLPAHGLIDPDAAFEDTQLDTKWRDEIDSAVAIAQKLGDRISIGGFSTGGALGLNKILRHPEMINGGLFLFSVAIDLGLLTETAGRFSFVQSITKITDSELVGFGKNPYKYPYISAFGAIELVQIINENSALLNGKKISQPVFVAHSMHDTTVKIDGLLDFLKDNVQLGISFILSQNISHSELVLEQDIALDESRELGSKKPPKANPHFDWMMENALRFFKTQVDV